MNRIAYIASMTAIVAFCVGCLVAMQMIAGA